MLALTSTDALFAACAIALSLTYLAYKTTRRRAVVAPEVKQQLEHVAPRKLGEWTPVPFDYPRITPCTDALADIPPRAYRPFKPGPYHVTMGIRNMDWDEWIELDRDFATYRTIRAARLASRRASLVQVLPDRAVVRGGAPAADELAQELAEFLSRRYPRVYEVTRLDDEEGWYGEGKVREIRVVGTGEVFDLEREEPMWVCAMLVPDDLALLLEGSDGQYYLQAGAIVVPGTWRLADKIGMPLDEIHTTGDVPYYAERLQPSLTRFFARLAPARPVVRNNWFFQAVGVDPDVDAKARDPEELAWYASVLGPEDKFVHVPSSYQREIGHATAAREDANAVPTRHGDAPSPAAHAPLPAEASAPTKEPAAPKPHPPIDIPRLRLRSERQSLRRLPRTGAIVFTIRTYKTPIEELAREPGMAARLLGALQGVREGAPETYRRMLSMEGLEGVLLGYLKQQAAADGDDRV